jgi:hypothetical protein
MSRAFFVILAVLAGLVLPASIAQAATPGQAETKDTQGASATCTVSADLSRIDCTVRDTEADKHSVFVEWKAMGRSGRFENSDGANSSRDFGDDLYRGVDTSSLKWKVCVDKQFDGDRCSDYATYSVGPNGQSIEVYCVNSTTAGDAITCYQAEHPGTGDDWHLTRGCVIGLGLAAGGLSKDGKNAVGRGLLTKVPGFGWVLTIGGLYTAVDGCG